MAKQTATLDKKAVLAYLKAVWNANKLNIALSKSRKDYYGAHVSSLRMQLVSTISDRIKTGLYDSAK